MYTFKHVWLNNKDTFCLYSFIKIISNILIQVGIGGGICQNRPNRFHPPIPTWSQDTYQGTWKDHNEIM